MGELLRREQLVPNSILSSTAKRAITTAELAAKSSGYQGKIHAKEQLYFTEPVTWFGLLQTVSDTDHCVMIVGHNPGLEEFLKIVTGEEEVLPTATLVVLTLAIDRWEEFDLGVRGELRQVWRPRELP